MKKITSFIFVASFLLGACSSDSDFSATTEDNALIKRITVTDDGTYYTDFFYSGKKIVKQMLQSGNPKRYTYTGNLITRIDTYDPEDTEIILSETFTYDATGRLSEYLETIDPGDPLTFEDKIEFTYNSDNTISCLWVSGSSGNFTDINGTAVIRLTDNEISSADITQYSDGTEPGDTYTLLYNYDGKNNPFKNIIGFSQLNLVDAAQGEGYGQVLGVNHNITTNGSLVAGATVIFSTTTYTYNSLNFPATSIKMTPDGPYPTVTATYTYY